MIFRCIRRIYRIPMLFLWLLWQGVYSLPIRYQRNKKRAVARMAVQTRTWGRGLLWIFGIRLSAHGNIEEYQRTGGLVVSNHMGYFDIFVHAALFGLRFTPKKDIHSWPILGWYTDMTLPIWVDRSSRQKSGELLEQFRETLRDKVPLIVYPEGTSTDGLSGILPFKATPFETVVGTDIPVQPVLTLYTTQPGDANPAWFGDDELMPHLWRVLGNSGAVADVYLLPQLIAGDQSRKELALTAHDMIADAFRKNRQLPETGTTQEETNK